MIQVGGGLCRLRLGPTPAPAASNGDRASPSRSRAHLTKAEKRCRTATPWPIALCSAPLVGFLNQAVMTAPEGVREQILPTPSRRERTAVACRQERSAQAPTRIRIGPTASVPERPPSPRNRRNSVGTLWARHLTHVERSPQKLPLNWTFTVVGTGVDPVTSRFSGARSTY